MLTVPTLGGELALLTRGNQANPLLVVLHGFPDHPLTFAPLLDLLAAGGYFVVAPWLRGYRPSVLTGPYDVDRLTADVLAVADEFAPGQPITLFGHDWGAVIAYRFATRFGERLASLISASVPHPATFMRALTHRPAQLRRSWYMFFFQIPMAPEIAVQRGLVERLWRSWTPGLELPEPLGSELGDSIAASLPGPLEYYRAAARTLFDRKLLDELRQPVSHRTLYLHGVEDRCIEVESARDQRQQFTGAYREEFLSGVGHFVLHETPELVASLVLEWEREHA